MHSVMLTWATLRRQTRLQGEPGTNSAPSESSASTFTEKAKRGDGEKEGSVLQLEHEGPPGEDGLRLWLRLYKPSLHGDVQRCTCEKKEVDVSSVGMAFLKEHRKRKILLRTLQKLQYASKQQFLFFNFTRDKYNYQGLLKVLFLN